MRAFRQEGSFILRNNGVIKCSENYLEKIKNYQKRDV